MLTVSGGLGRVWRCRGGAFWLWRGSGERMRRRATATVGRSRCAAATAHQARRPVCALLCTSGCARTCPGHEAHEARPCTVAARAPASSAHAHRQLDFQTPPAPATARTHRKAHAHARTHAQAHAHAHTHGCVHPHTVQMLSLAAVIGRFGYDPHDWLTHACRALSCAWDAARLSFVKCVCVRACTQQHQWRRGWRVYDRGRSNCAKPTCV